MTGFSIMPAIRNRYYSVATTSSSGTPSSAVVIASRCKYLGGWYMPVQTTGTNVTGFDVLALTGASSTVVPSAVTISSGVSVTTSTGTFGIPFGGQGNTSLLSTGAIFLYPGDQVQTIASTGVAGVITHVVQEF